MVEICSYIKARGRKGLLWYFLAFFILSIICIFIFGLITPVVIVLDTELYKAGDGVANLLNTSNEDIIGVVETAKIGFSDLVSILSAFFRYGWLLMIIIIVTVLLLKARTTVESEIR